jgi:hypothetical protein
LTKEIDNGSRLEAEISEKIKNVAKTELDIIEVKEKKSKEHEEHKKLVLQFEQIHTV